MLRDDSAMNISPAHFREFVMPYDIKILGEFGGGAVHFCGRGDHYIADMTSQYPMLYAINMSQPHLNDMEKIYRCTIDSGILLLGFDRNYAAAVTSDGRNSRGLIYS